MQMLYAKVPHAIKGLSINRKYSENKKLNSIISRRASFIFDIIERQ